MPAVAGCLRASARSAGRFFVGFFGVRELLLGAFIAGLRRRPEQLQAVVALGALADMCDTAFLVRDFAVRGVRPRTAPLVGTGLAGSVASLLVWREIARSRP